MKFPSPVNAICRFGLILAAFCAVAEASSRNTPPLSDWRFMLAEGSDAWAGLATDWNDEIRQARKDTSCWFQANWTTNAMTHIASPVEVEFKGNSLGKKTATDRRFILPEVKLETGANRVESYAYQNGWMIAADWDGWSYRADGDPFQGKSIGAQAKNVA